MGWHSSTALNEYFPDMDNLGVSAGDEPGVDSRYRSIISHLDLMLELAHLHPGRNLTPCLDRLLDTMVEHVASEETHMELVEFPEAAKHSLRHKFICINTARLRYRFSKGREPLARELAYIRLLWLEHIELHDRAFTEFLSRWR